MIFVVELVATAVTEKMKHSLQEKRAGLNRKINYLAYETKGLQEGKDIRIYAMVPWLREIARQVIARKDEVEERAANYQLQKLILTGMLILLKDSVAYGYLVYSFLQHR